MEKREDNRKSWVHVSNDPKECAFVVTRLTENHEYEFRIMAQNKFGVGPPLLSEPEKARNLFSKFRSSVSVEMKGCDTNNNTNNIQEKKYSHSV